MVRRRGVCSEGLQGRSTRVYSRSIKTHGPRSRVGPFAVDTNCGQRTWQGGLEGSSPFRRERPRLHQHSMEKRNTRRRFETVLAIAVIPQSGVPQSPLERGWLLECNMGTQIRRRGNSTHDRARPDNAEEEAVCPGQQMENRFYE